MAREEIYATNQVFDGDANDHNHFKWVGIAKGLVRVKDLHLGRLADLIEATKVETEDKQQEQRDDVTHNETQQ